MKVSKLDEYVNVVRDKVKLYVKGIGRSQSKILGKLGKDRSDSSMNVVGRVLLLPE